MSSVVYKTTDMLTDKIYIGVDTKNNPKYFGSGTEIKQIISEGRISDLRKEILFMFDTAEEAFNKEAELVTEEFILRGDVMNRALGGLGGRYALGQTIINDDGVNRYISIKDPDYISGKFTNISKDKTVVKDMNGNRFQVSINDERYLSGELVGVNKNITYVKDSNDNRYAVSLNDPRYLSGELIPINAGMVLAKDKNNNVLYINKNDFDSGEYTGINYGRTYIYHTVLNERRLIESSKLQMFLANGWLVGSGSKTAQGKKWVNNSEIESLVLKEDLYEFLDNNIEFKLGRLKKQNNEGISQ